MAEGVLFNLAGGIIERLGSLAFQEIGLLWGIKDELQNLNEKVAQLQAVLLDAEQKQANNEVKLWLQTVEDAVYEADDLLDKFHVEAQWRQMAPGDNKVTKQVRIFFSSSNQLAFGRKMGHKIKDINERLRVIASNRTFPLEVNHEDTRFVTRPRDTHSYVSAEDIIGRDEDKRAIIQLLLDPISTEKVSTISIVGFGGLGKTALAQLVVNDEMVQNHFELKLWICVSNVFKLNIIVKDIIQSATNEEPKNLALDQLQKTLRDEINGKRYLLVLDDVWNEDREKWLSLKQLLMGGAKGSRILITTRSAIVATKSDTATPYTLRGLDEKQSWSLFKKVTFDGKEIENLTIKEAGEQIVRKCRGVPLAIRTIGRMLHGEKEETKWFAFQNDKLSKIRQDENDVLPTLKLSYDVLPSHLKHCFAYCSLFPPDYQIRVDNLIKLWVAQGFVQSKDENECLEDVGYEYFKELLWRSFFQEEIKDDFGAIKSCKMHDIMNELAILVSRNKSSIIDLNWTNFDEKCRHVSLNVDVDSFEWKIPTSLLKANKIRTFLFVSQNQISYQSFCSTIASNFKSLRMLSLNGLRIDELPKCLRKMKHLRYLDLRGNSKMKRLPNWVVRLQNLETLDLSSCANLVELPRDIGKLVNLRHLILVHCYSLSGMPRGLGELTNLRTLSMFVLSENKSMMRYSAGLDELGRLQKLRGKVRIKNLRHGQVMMAELNDVAILKDKKHLDSLTLRWRTYDPTAVEEDNGIMSMEALQPHPNLKELEVRCYNGVRLASWVPSLRNIVSLKLFSCDRCQHLPPLVNLPSLKSLCLDDLKNLECISDKDVGDECSSSMSIGNEMMPASSTMTSTSPTSFFPSLTQLVLRHCPNLKGWWRVPADVVGSGSSLTAHLSLPSFPCLSELEISKCPSLTSMPLYPNVDRLRLWKTSWKVLPDMELFVTGGESDSTNDVHVSAACSSFSSPLSKLKSLYMENMDCVPARIGSLQSLISLQSLEIFHFPNLESLPEGIGNLKSLQKLSINYCPNLASLPEGIRRLTSLNKLVIWGCPFLEQRCKKDTGEDWLKIAHIANIQIY